MRIAAAAAALLVGIQWAAAEEQPLRTGVDATFAPHAMPTLNGGVEGFNIDLGNGIAHRLGRKLHIDATQFSGLVPGLQAGTYDFILAPVTVNKERAESMLFTEGYINTDFQFIVKKDTPDIRAMEELKGKTVAVNKGSTYDLWGRENAGKYGWTIEFLRHYPGCRSGAHVGTGLRHVARQYRSRLGGQKRSGDQAFLAVFDWAGIRGARAQGQCVAPQ